MKILVDNTAEKLRFYSSISSDDLERGFSSDYSYCLRTIDELKDLATKAKDTAEVAELDKVFKAYMTKPTPK